MSWNHRVVKLKQKNPLDPKYVFQEVHYNDKGVAGGYGDVFMVGDTKKEMEFIVKGLQKALEAPVLNEEDL